VGYAGSQGLRTLFFLAKIYHCIGYLLPHYVCILLHMLSLIFFPHQNTISVSGVGDGITSMAVHPHLPILAIGSMGQVRAHFFVRCHERLF
jgi:hypothetical protein